MLFRKSKATLVGDRQQFETSLTMLQDALKRMGDTLEERKALLKNYHRRLESWQK